MGEQESFQEALWRLANYGFYPKSLRQTKEVMDLHFNMMDEESKEGKPSGEHSWFAMKVVLGHLSQQYDRWEAREKHQDFFWCPYTIR